MDLTTSKRPAAGQNRRKSKDKFVLTRRVLCRYAKTTGKDGNQVNAVEKISLKPCSEYRQTANYVEEYRRTEVAKGELRWTMMANVETAFIGEGEARLCQGTVTGTLQSEYIPRMVALLVTGLLLMKTIFVATIAPAPQEQPNLQNPGRRLCNKGHCVISTLPDAFLGPNYLFYLLGLVSGPSLWQQALSTIAPPSLVCQQAAQLHILRSSINISDFSTPIGA